MNSELEERNRAAMEEADKVLASYREVCESLRNAMPFLREAAERASNLVPMTRRMGTGGVRLKRHAKLDELARLTRGMNSHVATMVRSMDAIIGNSGEIRRTAVTDQEPPFIDV